MEDFEEKDESFNFDKYTSEEWLLSNDEIIKELSQFYSAFSNPTRLRILLVLLKGSKCVGKIANTLKVDQSVISSHLKILRHLKLVKTKRNGRFVRYSIQDKYIKNVLKEGLKHILKIGE